MPIPNNQIRIAEVTFSGVRSTEGSTSKNYSFVFHYRRTTVSNVPDETVLKNVLVTGVFTNLVDNLNNTATFNQVLVRFIDDAQRAAIPFTVNLPGMTTGDSMPSHAALFILARTALRGRSYRGGKHFGPMSESDTTAGTADVLNAGAIGNWTSMITRLTNAQVDANGNTWVPCVLSRKPPSQLKVNPTTVITNDVTLMLLNKRIGNMRKRTVKSVY